MHVVWFSRYNLMSCCPRKLLEASTLKYGCLFKEDETWLTFNNTSQQLRQLRNKNGACSSRVLELPNVVETHQELPQRSNREWHPIVHKNFTHQGFIQDFLLEGGTIDHR